MTATVASLTLGDSGFHWNTEVPPASLTAVFDASEAEPVLGSSQSPGGATLVVTLQPLPPLPYVVGADGEVTAWVIVSERPQTWCATLRRSLARADTSGCTT